MRKIKFLLAAIALLVTALAYGQNITVTGKVYDASTGDIVPFASIQLKNTMTGANADLNGAYSITVPSDGILVFSSIGYITVEEPVAGRAIHDIELNPDAEALEETIVVAYGTSTKSSFTGSASVIKSETIEKRQVSNITNALSGTVAGVQALSSNGQPGVSASIRVRGVGSMNSNVTVTPLYVVDGLPYEGDISAISTQDIESMTVLKDAAASALYGARAANGVIIVTTKKGKVGDAQISFDARVGVNSRMITNYDVLSNPDLYMEKAYEAIYNGLHYNTGYDALTSNIKANQALFDGIGYQVYTLPEGQFLIGKDGKMNPNAKLGYSDGKYYYTPDDWAANTFRNKMRQEYNASVSGGTDKMHYYFSVGYLNDQGVIDGSDFTRINTRLNVDYQAKSWLKLGANLSYAYTTSLYPDDQTNDLSSGNAFYMANQIAPVYPMFVRDAKGDIMKDANTGYNVYDYGDGSSTNRTRNFMSISNPVSDLLYNTSQYLMDIMNSKWYAKVDIFDGLSFTATLGLHTDNTRYHYMGNKYYGQDAQYGGEVEQKFSRSYQLDQQYMLSYANSFGKHNFDFVAAYETMNYNSESAYTYGYNIYSDTNWTVSNAIDRINGSGSFGEITRLDWLTRLNYNYDNKYYATVSFRQDASSRFHPDHRWGSFWSGSLAWDLAREDFIRSIGWIDLLKAKASYGETGNDAIGNNYAYLDQYKVTGSDGVFADGTLYYKGNPDITWETSHSTNAGIDFELFNYRLGGTVEWFARQSSNMLYYKPVAPSNGYSEYPMNIGSMRNSGVEIELNYTPVQTKNFSWDINWNGTFQKNKIIALHPDLEGKMISGSRIYEEGYSMYRFYMVKYAGVDPETGKALFWAAEDDEDGNPIEGTEYKTDDQSKAYNTNRQPTMDLMPKFYGGFGTSLNAYGFDFSVQFAYQLGGHIWDYAYQDLMHGGSTSDLGRNWHIDILKAWTPENTETDVPRLDEIDSYASATSDRWLVSSNYLSLNNVTLGYTFPAKWTKKIGVETVRIYGSADNVAILTARKGLDPRQSYTTSTTSTYTAIRSISGGIKLTF